MAVLDTIGGEYSITSEKVDECPPNWASYAELCGLGGAVITFLISMYLVGTGNDAWIVMFIVGILFVVGMFSPILKEDCGVKIALLHGSATIHYDYYQLTSDPNHDAQAIQNKVERFKQYANRLIEERSARKKAEQVKQEQCCNRYTEVIQKVKGE